FDGSGYPDHLTGHAIPLGAQIVGILEVYDALTTARARQPALAPEQALREITRYRAWWSEPVYRAFVQAVSDAQGAPLSSTRASRWGVTSSATARSSRDRVWPPPSPP